MRPDRSLIDEVRAVLADGDPARAKTQQAYMKSTMPYAGVTTPELRRAIKAIAPRHRLGGWRAWHDTLLTLWREASVREERYAALELAGLPLYAAHATSLESLPMYEEFIVDGAWWDHVDTVAVHHIGPLLLAHPEPDYPELAALMRRWSTDADRWRRRTSVICQVGAKDRVDTKLLADTIVANIADRDFFLRKAIGWALRQHARVDPSWVRAFVAAHPELSPLSRREAMRHLGTV